MNRQAASIVESLISSTPAALDLADESQLQEVISAAERVVESFPTRPELAELESVLCERKAEVPLAVHLAAKLARSRRVILDLDRPLHLSVVFAAYKEHHRILTREQHENGENFLFAKLAQLFKNFSLGGHALVDNFPGLGHVVAHLLITAGGRFTHG